MSNGFLLRQNDDGTWGRYEPYTTIVVETEDEFTELNKRLELAEKMQWIPCSERLPKDLEDVLVWVSGVFISGAHVGEECQWYGTGYMINAKWNVECYKHIKDIKVIAWMPLPEPYKGEQP